MWSPDLEADNQSDLYLLPNKLQEHLLPRSTKKRDYKSGFYCQALDCILVHMHKSPSSLHHNTG